MEDKPDAFTIDNFYKFIENGKLMAAECNKCGKLLVPPRPICSACLSKDLKWRELRKQGKLLTYTVIHVSPKSFQQQTPYPVGIVELEDGGQLPGMIKGVELDKVKIGISLTLDVEHEADPEKWPQWPRYYFKPTT